MTNAGQILVVGAVDCNDRVNTFLVSFSLGKPSRVASEYGGPTVDVAGVGTVDTSALVESRFTVAVKAASPDAVMAIVAAITTELGNLSPITVGLKNSAYVGALVPKIAECIEIPQEAPWDSRLVNANSTLIEIIVRREPWIYSPVETLCSRLGIDAPALVDLSDQIGQHAAPLGMLLDAGALELAGCYVGHTADESATIADFVLPLVGATWSAGAADADAAGYPAGVGNTIWQHTAAAYTDLAVPDYAPGEYLVLANCKGTTANTDTIQHAYCDPVLIPTTALRLLPLGVVSLPTRSVSDAAASTLRLTITGGGAAEYAAVNYVALLPVSGGVGGYVLSSGHVHRLRWQDGTLYADDAVDLAHVFGGSLPLRTLAGQLVILAEQATAAPTTHLHATVADEPRWEQFPSETGLTTMPGLGLTGFMDALSPAVADSGWAAYDLARGRQYLRETTNLAPRGSFGVEPVGVGGVAEGYSHGGDIAGTPVFTLIPGRNGVGLAQRIEYTGVAGDAGGKGLTFFGSMVSRLAACAPGDKRALSIYVRFFNAVGDCTCALRHIFWDSGSAYIGEGSTVSVPMTWEHYVRKQSIDTVPAGAAASGSWITVANIQPGDTIDLILDDLQIEPGDSVTPYFDGSYPNCHWEGDPFASVSTRERSSHIFVAGSLVPAQWSKGTIAVRHVSMGTVAGSYRTIVGIGLDVFLGWHSNGHMYLILDGGAALSTEIPAPTPGVVQTIIARWNAGYIDVNVDGIDLAQTASTAVGLSGVALGIGSRDEANPGREHQGQIADLFLSSVRKPDSWVEDVAANGARVLTNQALMAADCMDAGDAFLPLTEDGMAYKKTVAVRSTLTKTGLVQLAFDGDSNTETDMGGITCWPELLVASLGGSYTYNNFARGGWNWEWLRRTASHLWTTSELYETYPSIDDCLQHDAPVSIAFMLCGTNDFLGVDDSLYTAEEVWEWARLYLSERRAAGFKMVLLSVLPCYPGNPSIVVPADYEQKRQDFHTMARNGWREVADVFVDFSDDPYIGVATAFADHPTYWMNEAHISAIGRAHLAEIVKNAIAGLL